MLTRSRYFGSAELERILNAIAEKMTAAVEHIYLYGEDQRLATAK